MKSIPPLITIMRPRPTMRSLVELFTRLSMPRLFRSGKRVLKASKASDLAEDEIDGLVEATNSLAGVDSDDNDDLT